MAGLSDVAVVLRTGRARCVVLVCRPCDCQWSARLGLCSGSYGPGWPRLVAVGCPLRHVSPVRRVLSCFAWLRRVHVLGCCVVAITMFGGPLSSPPNGRPVLLSDVLGRGGRAGSGLVVPVALGRHRTL